MARVEKKDHQQLFLRSVKIPLPEIGGGELKMLVNRHLQAVLQLRNHPPGFRMSGVERQNALPFIERFRNALFVSFDLKFDLFYL